MAVSYVIEFDVHPDEHDRFLPLLTGVLDTMREESAFREAVLHRDPSLPYRYMLYETWENHEDVLTVQLRRSYREAWHSALPSLLVNERRISIWEPLRHDRCKDQDGESRPTR
jgi:quinol monooxygenase YgiN